MASYNFYENYEAGLPLRDRFASIADSASQDETLTASLALWQATFTADTEVLEVDALRTLLTNLRAIDSLTPRPQCPVYRLFVSHRQIDKDFGLRVAKLANNNGFEFWLDVLDPTLAAVAAHTHLSKDLKALLTACVIEMGLINSTHVLAVMTWRTKGSLWVPYEYGRVRQPGNTACWKKPSHKFTLPDYMLLGATTQSESDINQWLHRLYKPGPRCLPITWQWAATIPLP